MSRLYITAKSTPHHLEKKWMFQGKKKNWAELRAVIILINNLQFPSPSDKQEPAFPSAPLPLASAPSQLWEKRWQKHKSRAMLSHAFPLSCSSAPSTTMPFPLQGILYHWRLKADSAAVWFGPRSCKQVNCRNAEVTNQDQLGWRQPDKQQQVRVWFASFSYTSSHPAAKRALGRMITHLQKKLLVVI